MPVKQAPSVLPQANIKKSPTLWNDEDDEEEESSFLRRI